MWLKVGIVLHVLDECRVELQYNLRHVLWDLCNSQFTVLYFKEQRSLCVQFVLTLKIPEFFPQDLVICFILSRFRGVTLDWI